MAGAAQESAQPPAAPSGLARRILAFAGLPFLSLITPFLFLPILARVAGADAWLAIAVGQSSGGFFALVVALGYNTVGPVAVAVAPAADRAELYARSLRARAAVWLPATVAAVAVAALVSPAGYRVAGALMAVAMTLTGLAASWYLIGLGRPGLIVVFEILPRIAATLLAALLVVTTLEVAWYPILLIVATLASGLVFAARTVGLRDLLRARPGAVREVIAANRSAVTTEVAGGAYNALAVTFVGATAVSAQAATYVSGDKLYRIGQYSVSALGNSLQAWVVEAGQSEFARRTRLSLLIHAALGLAGFAGFALLGAPLSGFLFGEKVAISEPTALGLGAATIGIALGTAIGRITLIALGARRQFMTSVLIGASAGVPAILVLSHFFGAAGGAWGLATGELVSVTAQTVAVIRAWRATGGRISAPAGPAVQPDPTPPSS